MGKFLNRFSMLALLGAVVGGLAASLAGPRFVIWYSSPGGKSPALCDCADLAGATMERLLFIQAAGAISGALLFVILGAIVSGSKKTDVKTV